MKIIFLFVLLNLSVARKVSRIIRTHYDLPLTFRGDKFKELVDSEFSKFEDTFEKLKEKIENCIRRKIIAVTQAKEKCLGNDFEVFEDRFNLFTYKIDNIYENMIEVAFNENCLDKQENSEQCYELLDDIKILRFNNYIIIQTIRHNKDRYITDNFTQDHLDRILDSIKYAIDKYEEYKDTLDDKKIVLKGLLWNFFLEEKAKTQSHNIFDENDEDLNLLDEIGGEDKFFAKKLMSQIGTNFAELKAEFHEQQSIGNDREDRLVDSQPSPKKPKKI